MKTYFLKPRMTPATQPSSPVSGKPADTLPQPLPRPVADPTRPRLCLGLDVHLEFIMAVAQRDHLGPQAPRRFTRGELVAQVARWIGAGLQVFCVQESCGFGFVLHRELVAAGARSFLITPVSLNDRRKTDKLDARALCQRLVRWVDGNKDELRPIRIPSEAEQRRRETTRRRQFLARQIRCLANRGHGQVAEHCHEKLPSRWWGARNWRKLSGLDPWIKGVLEKLR
jgi:transposase